MSSQDLCWHSQSKIQQTGLNKSVCSSPELMHCKVWSVCSQIALLSDACCRWTPVPYSFFARVSKALTICLTTSSKNIVASCEWSRDLNSNVTKNSTLQDCPAAPGVNRHSVSRWLKREPSVHTARTWWLGMTVTSEVYLSTIGGNPISSWARMSPFRPLVTFDFLHHGTNCWYCSTLATTSYICSGE